MGKKARKPITTKEPPVPTDSHAEIEDRMIRLLIPEMRPLVERLDGSIRETWIEEAGACRVGDEAACQAATCGADTVNR